VVGCGVSDALVLPKTCPQGLARPDWATPISLFPAEFRISRSRPPRRAPPFHGGALCAQIRQQKPPFCSGFKPSPGLEPGTASLPWRFRRSRGGVRRPLYMALSLQKTGVQFVRVCALSLPGRTRWPRDLSPQRVPKMLSRSRGIRARSQGCSRVRCTLWTLALSACARRAINRRRSPKPAHRSAARQRHHEAARTTT